MSICAKFAGVCADCGDRYPEGLYPAVRGAL